MTETMISTQPLNEAAADHLGQGLKPQALLSGGVGLVHRLGELLVAFDRAGSAQRALALGELDDAHCALLLHRVDHAVPLAVQESDGQQA